MGCGSCWAFATVAALESAILRTNNTPNIDINLSEQILISCSGAGSCLGGYTDNASDYIKNTGVPLETCYTNTYTDGNCQTACANWQNNAYKIANWLFITNNNDGLTIDKIKNALITNGPVAASMNIHNDFYHYDSGIYSCTTSETNGDKHIVLVIGYDNAEQYFIAKNSWGTGWGESGYLKIAFSEIESVVKFGYDVYSYGNAIDPLNTRIISATSGSGGSISPSGAVVVNINTNQSFSITPNSGYQIANVLVDSDSVGSVASYTFTNVTINHTISASFSINTCTISASTSENGSISPSGTTIVNIGSDQTFSIIPNTGYHIADVLVDSDSVGPVVSYTFTDVIANHTISASFAINTYSISASTGENGSISPSGTITLNYGTSQIFSIIPDSGYHVSYIKVDGNYLEGAESHAFLNINNNHTIYISFTENKPYANLIANKTIVYIPDTVQFYDSSTGSINSWLWNFGDGKTSNLPNPLHIYDSCGIYSISLKVGGPGGYDSTKKQDYIRMFNRVVISPNSSTLVLNSTLQFSAVGGVPPYMWSVNDTTARIDNNGLLAPILDTTSRYNKECFVSAKDQINYISVTGAITIPYDYQTGSNQLFCNELAINLISITN